MATKKLRYGIIGVGRMGEFHLNIAKNLPAIGWLGIFDSNPDRLSEVSTKHCIDQAHAFNDIDALTNSADAFSLCSPSDTHFEIASKLIRAGKHVLVEKPLSTNSSDARSLRQLAMENRITLAAGHIERFNPAYAVLLDYLRRHMPLTVSARRASPFPERMAQISVVWDMMIHDLDLILHIARSKPDKIDVRAKKEKSDFVDEVSAKIFFDNGLLAEVFCSRLASDRERLFTVGCEEFNLEANLKDRVLQKKSFAPPGENVAFVTENIPVENYDQLTAEIDDFIKAIRRETSPTVTADDAISAIELAEKIEELALA